MQNSAKMNRRWICGDVWMDILPSFNRPQLGLKMALISDRFDVLVDAHFDGKSELTIWRCVAIRNVIGPRPKLSVQFDDKFVDFPLPDHSLPDKIRFRLLQIEYIDHSVITFLRSNKQIWDRMGTNLALEVYSYERDVQPIWNAFVPEIWPIVGTNIRHLSLDDGDHLANLRRRISPTILTDSIQLNSIYSGALLPDGIADDGPNATAGQELSKWLHTPTTDGQPKQLYRNDYVGPLNLEWVNNFKETFLFATPSVSYIIQLCVHLEPTPNEQFELVNERTKEKLTLKQKIDASNEAVYNWLLKRCPIGESEIAPIKWKNRANSGAHFNYIRFELRYDNYSGANLNSVRFDLWGGNDYIG